MPIRLVYLMGVEANRYILAEHPENFTWREAFALLEVVDGPTALVLSDGEEHRRRRRLVQPGFAIKRVDSHLELVTGEIDATLDRWTAGRSLDALDELRAAVRRIVVRALFGDHLGGDADRIGDLLEPALRYVGRTPLSRIDVNLPFLPYGKAVRAANAVDAVVMTEIERRRRDESDPSDSIDVLSALLAASERESKGDDPLSDREICDQIRSLIAAGYDTTSSAAAWLVYGLGANPATFEQLRTQVQDTIGNRAPTLEDLRALPLVDGVVRETLRLWPPAAFSGRRAIEDFDLHGYRIPGGSMVMYSPYITHRLPDVWGDPLVYRPQRWNDGEPEPFSFVPFGGGYRKCIGFALATLELQVLTVRLAQRVTYQLHNPNVRPAGIANFAPKGGLPITVTTNSRTLSPSA